MRTTLPFETLSWKWAQKEISPVWLVRFQSDHFSPHSWFAWCRQVAQLLGRPKAHMHTVYI